jgi:uncharacterized membrane protein YciS (DUF1049 family)
MTTLLALLFSKAGGLIAGGLAMVGFFFAGRLSGASITRARARSEQAEAKAATLERIADAEKFDAGKPADVAAARQRLRNRAK